MDSSADEMDGSTVALRRSSRRSVAVKKSYKIDENSSGSDDDAIETKEKAPPKKKARKPLKAKNNEDDDFVPEEPENPVQKSRKRKSPAPKEVAEKKPRKAAKPKAPKATKGSKVDVDNEIDSNNNNTLTAPGSSKKTHSKAPKKVETPAGDDDDSDDDEDGWEDECELHEAPDLENYQPELPSMIKIDMAPKKKCGRQPGDWVFAWIQQNINKMRKNAHQDAHKVHLLSFIGRLQYLNNICNNETVKSMALSLLPEKVSMKSMSKTLEKFEDFFFDCFSVNIKPKTLNRYFDTLTVVSAFKSRKIDSQVTLNVLLVAFLRLLGFTCRLVYFINPISVKCPNLLTKLKKKEPAAKENKAKGKAKAQDSDEEESEDYESDTSDSDDDGKAKKKKAKSKAKPKSKDSSSPTKSPYFQKEKATVSEPEAMRYWIEIYDSSKKVWKVFESEHNHVRRDEIIKELPEQIRYILAIDNEGIITEVTARYCDDWFSHQIKTRRIEDTDWWAETLQKLARPQPSEYEDADAQEFSELLKNVPLPKTVGEYKNHQLFVLEKDVLKFQGIYPRETKIVGYFRNQPVFPRDCVHTLRSRENWLRRAKSVRLHQIPYKTVASSFRTNPDTGKKEDLELFGEWQIEDYVPPVAKNGIVPRNAYNNVELFMDCMLPVGTVHIKLPGLMRIAGKLNIDCVPAVVGFDTAKGGRKGSHPVIDGFVVCKEFEDTLRAAWQEEQVNVARREEERKQKRIWGNWKRLIKGLLIKQRLQHRFVD